MTKIRIRLLSVFLLLLLVCAADAATHDVYPGDLIQPVINTATAGDTILVHQGDYSENIRVNKSLNLIGDNAIIVAANSSQSTFHINADHVTVSGFVVNGSIDRGAGIAIRNSSYITITDNEAHNNIYGIHSWNSSHNFIEGNNAYDNVLYNIALLDTADTIVSNNSASDGQNCGIGLSESCNNTIKNNTVNRNPQYSGVLLYIECYNNIIENNMICQNKWYGGILLFTDCGNNTIRNNDISNNSGYYGGITSYGCDPNNVFYGNRIVNSTPYSIRFLHSPGNLIYNNVFASHYNHVESGGVNTWNITPTTGPNIIGGPEIGGNYWSDYTGNDTDNDGFGDTPYTITTGSYDYHPLVHTHVLCGDVVPDGEINILDLTSLLNIVVAGDMIDPCVGDTDGNRDLNILDVRRLIMYINDPINSPLNCGC